MWDSCTGSFYPHSHDAGCRKKEFKYASQASCRTYPFLAQVGIAGLGLEHLGEKTSTRHAETRTLDLLLPINAPTCAMDLLLPINP